MIHARRRESEISRSRASRDPTGCIEFRASSSCTFWPLSLLNPGPSYPPVAFSCLASNGEPRTVGIAVHLRTPYGLSFFYLPLATCTSHAPSSSQAWTDSEQRGCVKATRLRFSERCKVVPRVVEARVRVRLGRMSCLAKIKEVS